MPSLCLCGLIVLLTKAYFFLGLFWRLFPWLPQARQSQFQVGQRYALRFALLSCWTFETVWLWVELICDWFYKTYIIRRRFQNREINKQINGAGDRIRTGDSLLGRQELYRWVTPAQHIDFNLSLNLMPRIVGELWIEVRLGFATLFCHIPHLRVWTQVKADT